MASQAFLQFTVSVNNQATQVANQIANSFSSLGATVVSLNQGLELASRAFQSLGDTVGEAIQQFSSFDKSLNLIERVTGVSEESIHALGDSLTQLATKMNIVKTSQLAKLADDAATVGIRGSQNLLKFAETMAKVQEIIGELGPSMSRTIVSVLNALGQGVEGIDEFANVLTRLRQSTASSVESILTFAGRLSEAGAQFNLTSAQILALSAAASEIKGLQAQRFGTAFNRSLNELRDAALNGTAGMRELGAVTGLTRDQFLQIIKDNPTQAFLILSQAVDGIIKSGKSATGLLESLHLQSSETSQVISDVGKNFEAFSQKIGLANKEAREQLILQQEWEVTQKRFQSATDALARSWQQVQIAFGRSLSPIATVFFNTLAKALTTAHDIFVKLPSAVQTVLGVFATLALGSAAVATAVAAIGTVLGAFGITAAGVSAAVGTTLAAMFAPWAVAVAAFVAGLAIIYAKWDEIKEYFRDNSLTSIILGAMPSNLVVKGVKTFWQTIYDASIAGLGKLSDKFKSGDWKGAIMDGLAYMFKPDSNFTSQMDRDLWGWLAKLLEPPASVFERGKQDLAAKFKATAEFAKTQSQREFELTFGTPKFIGPGNITAQQHVDQAFKDFNNQVKPEQRIGIDSSKVEFDTSTKQLILSLDKQAAAVEKLESARKQLENIERDPNNPLFSRIAEASGEQFDSNLFLTRARGQFQQQVRLANPVNQFLQGAGDEFQKLQAITGEDRNRQEIEAKITELQRQRIQFGPGEVEAIKAATQALQQQRAAQGLGVAVIGAQNQLVTARAVTQEQQNQAAIQVRINDLVQQYGKSAVEANRDQLNQLLQIEDLTRRISQAKTVLSQAQPIAAAYIQQQNALAVITDLENRRIISSSQSLALQNQIKQSMLDQVNPIAALQRAQALELAQLSTSIQYREADSKTLQQIYDLKMRGLDLDKNSAELLQQYNRLLQDIQRTQNSGFEGFYKQVGDTKQAILDSEKDFANGLSTALTGVLTGQQNAWQNFINTLSSSLIKRGVDLLLKDAFQAVGAENLFGLGSKGLIDQAKGLSGQLGKSMSTAMMQVQAGTVNINGAVNALANGGVAGAQSGAVGVPGAPTSLSPSAANDNTVTSAGTVAGAVGPTSVGGAPISIAAGSGGINVDTAASATPVLNFPTLSSAQLPVISAGTGLTALAAGGALTAGGIFGKSGAMPNGAETVGAMAYQNLNTGLPLVVPGIGGGANFGGLAKIATAPGVTGNGFPYTLTADMLNKSYLPGSSAANDQLSLMAQSALFSPGASGGFGALTKQIASSQGVGSNLIDKLKFYEGYKSHAYFDGSQYSIGYGTKATSPTEVINQTDALARLQTETTSARKLVDDFAARNGIDLTSGQKDALTSLTFNTGNKWMNQNLGEALKQGDTDLAQNIFAQYNKSGGVFSKGLNWRRQDELKTMFNRPEDTTQNPLSPDAIIPKDTLDRLKLDQLPNQLPGNIPNQFNSPFGNIMAPGQQASLQLPGLEQVQTQLASASGSISSYASVVANSGSSALTATSGIDSLVSSLGKIGSGGGGFNIGGLFGGGGGGFDMGYSDYGFAHGGGLIGFSSLATRRIHSSVFAGAPKFHSGLMDDEFPTVLQRGERVLTANDNARTTAALRQLGGADNPGRGGGRGPAPIINYNITTPDVSGFQRNETQINARGATAYRRAYERNS